MKEFTTEQRSCFCATFMSFSCVTVNGGAELKHLDTYFELEVDRLSKNNPTVKSISIVCDDGDNDVSLSWLVCVLLVDDQNEIPKTSAAYQFDFGTIFSFSILSPLSLSLLL